MPPKNKKQLQEQARRLQQQQKKRQEQQRRLEQERKKYASQTISTGLTLPISNQLLTEFSINQFSFFQQKFTHVLQTQYKNLKNQKLINQILKQMAYVLKNAKKTFKLPDNCTFQSNQNIYLKIRISCGIFLKIFLNDHPSIAEQGQRIGTKIKQNDQNLLRQLLIAHSQTKKENQLKIFNKNQILECLKFFKTNYFDHFLILHKSSNFPKREDQKINHLYINCPWTQKNTKQTIFVDLSGSKNEEHKQHKQGQKQ